MTLTFISSFFFLMEHFRSLTPRAGPNVKRIDLQQHQACRKRRQNCAQTQFGRVPRWWNGILLTCYILGLSGYNTKNLTANHSGTPCWERGHVPRTLKNPPLEAKLPDHTHPSPFLVAIKICRPYYPCVPIPFFISLSFHVILSSILCSSPEYSLKLCCSGVKPQQSVNRSLTEINIVWGNESFSILTNNKTFSLNCSSNHIKGQLTKE